MTCLLGASADDGPIDASYVQYATEYVAYMHERFVQKRQHHDKMLSLYELNVGVKPRLDQAIPFGTPGICFCSPQCAQGAGLEQVGKIRTRIDVGLPTYVFKDVQVPH